MTDMIEDEWFSLTIQVLRDLASQIKLRQIRPLSLSTNRAYERVENERGEVIDFKPGNYKLTLEYEATIPKEVLDGGK